MVSKVPYGNRNQNNEGTNLPRKSVVLVDELSAVFNIVGVGKFSPVPAGRGPSGAA
jgi:hypothetical protein